MCKWMVRCVSGPVTANSFVSTGAGPWSVTGSFGTLGTAASGKSLLGFGTSGKLQVSENGAAVVEVAKLDVTGKSAGNATTATAFAHTPTQCSNSFATGIQANTTGTSLNFLAKYNGASAPCALKAGTGDTDGVIGVVSGGAGTSGNAVVAYRGYAQCSLDGGTAAGDYVVASVSNAGDCHDAGATRPVGTQVIGRALNTNASAGTYPSSCRWSHRQPDLVRFRGSLSQAPAARCHS